MAKRIIKKWSNEELEFLREQYKVLSQKDLLVAFNQHFNEEIAINQLISCLKNHKIKSGRDGRFIQGHDSWNKGMKGLILPGSEKGWFKKGGRAINYKPVGHERIDADGYILVKISDTGKWHERWRHKHKIVWEEHNGPIPANHVILLVDGNRKNCDIDNLRCVEQDVNLFINNNGLRIYESELVDTTIELAKVMKNATERLKREC